MLLPSNSLKASKTSSNETWSWLMNRPPNSPLIRQSRLTNSCLKWEFRMEESPMKNLRWWLQSNTADSMLIRCKIFTQIHVTQLNRQRLCLRMEVAIWWIILTMLHNSILQTIISFRCSQISLCKCLRLIRNLNTCNNSRGNSRKWQPLRLQSKCSSIIQPKESLFIRLIVKTSTSTQPFSILRRESLLQEAVIILQCCGIFNPMREKPIGKSCPILRMVVNKILRFLLT